MYKEKSSRPICGPVVWSENYSTSKNWAKCRLKWYIQRNCNINPSVTARVKISLNVDILAKVYLVHLKYIYRSL